MSAILDEEYEFIKHFLGSALKTLKNLQVPSTTSKVIQGGISGVTSIPATAFARMPLKQGAVIWDDISQKNKTKKIVHAIFSYCDTSQQFYESFCTVFIKTALEIYHTFQPQLNSIYTQVNTQSNHMGGIITLAEFCGKICFEKMVDTASTQNLEEAIGTFKYFGTNKIINMSASKWNGWTLDNLILKLADESSIKMSAFQFFETPRPAYYNQSTSGLQAKWKHVQKFYECKLQQFFWRKPFQFEWQNVPRDLVKVEEVKGQENFIWSEHASDLIVMKLYKKLSKDFSFNDVRAIWETLGDMSNTLNQIADRTDLILKNVVGNSNQDEKEKARPVVLAYFGNWATFREGNGKFDVEDIDPFLCTHLVYSFAGVGDDHKIKSLEPYHDLADHYGRDGYSRFTSLKEINPKLKCLLAVGGWVEGSERFSKMAATQETRQIFIESCLKRLEYHNFDGLELNWEFPGSRGGVPEDKENFVLLLKELSDVFVPRNFLLNAAVSANSNTIMEAYDIPLISKYVDYINVMTYDFHGSWEDKVNHHSPLFGYTNGDILNADYALNYWLRHGAKKEQLILGMGAHGRGWTLKESTTNGINAPVQGPSDPGPYTNEPGVLSYNEILEKSLTEPWTFRWDPKMQVPFAFNGNQWIGFDDPQSIRLKGDYIKRKGLAGGMVWFLEMDDFKGLYGPKYALIGALKSALN